MAVFLVVFVALIVLNSALLFFSLVGSASNKVSKEKKAYSGQQTSKILPMDLMTSKYKKAV